MAHAQLINRGEQFAVTDGSTRFEGECVWSHEKVPGVSMPRTTYPLRILVRSIGRTGLGRLLPISLREQRRVGQLAKQLLQTDEPDCEIQLLEND